MTLHMPLMGGSVIVDPCADSPTIISCVLDSEVVNTCGSNGWVTTWKVAPSVALPAGLEYYWESTTVQSATPSAFHSRGTSETIDVANGDVGSANVGNPKITAYANVRVYIVPVGEPKSEACVGPTEAGEESEFNWGCFA
jgi:hypothetical protein